MICSQMAGGGVISSSKGASMSAEPSDVRMASLAGGSSSRSSSSSGGGGGVLAVHLGEPMMVGE